MKHEMLVKVEAVTLEVIMRFILSNIAKGTTDPRVEFISQVLSQILVKFQFQNLD